MEILKPVFHISERVHRKDSMSPHWLRPISHIYSIGLCVQSILSIRTGGPPSRLHLGPLCTEQSTVTDYNTVSSVTSYAYAEAVTDAALETGDTEWLLYCRLYTNMFFRGWSNDRHIVQGQGFLYLCVITNIFWKKPKKHRTLLRFILLTCTDGGVWLGDQKQTNESVSWVIDNISRIKKLKNPRTKPGMNWYHLWTANTDSEYNTFKHRLIK